MKIILFFIRNESFLQQQQQQTTNRSLKKNLKPIISIFMKNSNIRNNRAPCILDVHTFTQVDRNGWKGLESTQ